MLFYKLEAQFTEMSSVSTQYVLTRKNNLLLPYLAFILHPYFSEATDQNGALPSP